MNEKKIPPDALATFTNLQIENATDNEELISSQSNSVMAVDSETEARLLGEIKKATKKVKSVELKAKHGYKNSLKYLQKMSKKDPVTLTEKDKNMIKKHTKGVKKYELRLNSTATNKEVDADNAATKMTKIILANEDNAKNTDTTEKRSIIATTFTSSTLQATSLSNDVRPGVSTKFTTIPVSDRPSGSRDTIKPNRKRKRSTDGEIQVKIKKPNTIFQNNKELLLAIIDRNHPDGKLSMDNWLRIEANILKAIVAENEKANANNICKFNGAAWQKGVKIVGCGNQDSFNFIAQCIQNQSHALPGIQLDTIPVGDLPLRTMVYLWIPPPVPQDQSVLSLLHMQNPEFNTKSWQLVESKMRPENGGGKDYRFLVDKESVRKIKVTEGAIKFGLGNLRVHLVDGGKSCIRRKATSGSN